MGNTQYRWLLFSNTAHFFTFSATLLLRSLLAWELTGDEMSLAYLNMAAASCLLVASIFSGAVIDRVERRKLMLMAQVVQLSVEAGVLVLLVLGHISFGYLMFSAVVFSTMSSITSPARTAMTVQVVDRSVYGKALTMMAGGGNVARMASPAIAGLIADQAGIAYGYGVLMAIYGYTLYCTFNFQPSRSQAQGERASLLGEIREGFVYIAHHRPLAMCVLFGLLPILVVIPFQHMMVVFVDHLWQQGPSGMGIMLGATGIGGLLGSLFTVFAKDGKLARPLAIAGLLVGVFLLVFCHTPWFWAAVLLIVCVYSCSVMTQTLVQTGVQLMTEERYRGRVTTMTVMSYGLAPLGSLPLAYATKHIGPSWALTMTSLALIAAILLMWFYVPSFRKIDEATKNH